MGFSRGYETVFGEATVSFFVSLPKRKQRKLLDSAQKLAADPFVVPDFHSVDSTGRETSQLMADGYIFDFWVDHAVKQVIIIEISHVE